MKILALMIHLTKLARNTSKCNDNVSLLLLNMYSGSMGWRYITEMSSKRFIIPTLIISVKKEALQRILIQYSRASSFFVATVDFVLFCVVGILPVSVIAFIVETVAD